MADERELLARLDQWLAGQRAPVTLVDVQKTDDLALVAAFILKAFRTAARNVVVARIECAEAAMSEEGEDLLATCSMLRVFNSLARVWALDLTEQVRLLGLGTQSELAELQQASTADVPAEVVERVAILFDIFRLISILLPVSTQAEGWMRAPCPAPQFAGRSALELMLEMDLEGMVQVRRYLQGHVSDP